jgi:hypothetical protein
MWVLGQTRLMSSSLPASSPRRSMRAIRISNARLPRRTGVSPSKRSRRLGSRRKEPNANACSVEKSAGSAIGAHFRNVATRHRRAGPSQLSIRPRTPNRRGVPLSLVARTANKLGGPTRSHLSPTPGRPRSSNVVAPRADACERPASPGSHITPCCTSVARALACGRRR